MVVSQINTKEVLSLFSEKSFDKAQHVVENYLKNNPDDLEAIELLGDAYGHQEKWGDASKQYKKLLSYNQENANYHYKYGGALGMKALENKLKAIGFIGDIKSSFLKAAALDKNHVDTRWALVELYIQLPSIFGGSKSKALKYAEELEQLSKVDGYLAKGYVYEYNGDPELAETYYKKGVREGGSLVCFDKLTSLYEKNGVPEKAIKNIEKANERHSRNALHYQIGKIAADYNIELDKGERCLLLYMKQYSVKDGIPKAWANYRLAQIYTHKGYKDDALRQINLAIEKLPNIKVFQIQKDLILNL